MKIGSCSGKSDSIWDPYGTEEASRKRCRNTGGKNDFISKMVTAVQKMDANQMNEQINKMSQSISSLQSLLSQFSGAEAKNMQKQSGWTSIRFLSEKIRKGERHA